MLAAASPPAGGAEMAQVVIGTLVVGVWTSAVMLLGLQHRAGRTRLLDRAAAPLERLTGLPGWAVLPPVVGLLGFATAGPGFVWDVGIHIAQGRDDGPFANPSHYLLILGILCFFTAGWLACAMPRERLATGVRVTRTLSVPAAGVVMLGAASLALLGFPLDDVWHRLFGQDVTLWGPTHLAMITGGLLHFFGGALLIREGRRATGRRSGTARLSPLPTREVCAVVVTGFAVAYLQEFGYGVPQFRLEFQPAITALAAGIGFVWVRMAVGAGAALVVAGIAIVTQSVLSGLTVAAGEPLLHFPLFLAEAALVELAAAAVLARRGPLAFALTSGVLLGTAGVLAGWGWSHLWMPLAWPAAFVPGAIPYAVACGTGGALLGLFAARCFAFDPPPEILRRGAWRQPAAGLALALAALAALLPAGPAEGTATVALDDPGEARSHATVRIEPAGVTRDASWVHALAWQGGGIVTAALREVSPGVWRTTEPVPLTGAWKSVIRVHRGARMSAAAVRLPADPAIPAPAIPAAATVERPLVDETTLLQRERRSDVPGWWWPAASTSVFLAVLALLIALGWAMLRVARGGRAAGVAATAPRTTPAEGTVAS